MHFSGPLASSAGISGLAAISSSLAEPNHPDIMLNHIGVGPHLSFGLESDQAFGLKTGTLQQYYAPYAGKDAAFVTVTLGRSKSIGEIRLKSFLPFDYPIIDPKYFSHPEDIQSMLEGVSIP